jgi:undecaprenyl-phosphate alpha-N-acetylglucosaminyltransferase
MEVVSIILLVITFVVSFAFTALLMPRLIELCRQKGLYDQPNERKVHHNKIPRLGGLLFAPAMSIGIVAGFLYLGVSVESSQLPVFRLSTMILMAGLFLIYLIGVLDDLLGSARV